jgi:hypothetical protein
MRLKYLSLGIALAGLFATSEAQGACPAVAAAETIVNINAAFTHTQYHENATEGTGDDESGYSPGFGVGASALLPVTRDPVGPDLYTSFAYDFSAGDLHYGGHYLFSGLPATATDNAVFNRIEARIGIGFPLIYGGESIPFITGGYQAWNRNDNQKGVIGSDEFYHTGFVGGGLKLDLPITAAAVISLTGEVLGLVGGGVTNNDFGISGNFGPSGEQRVNFGVDYNVTGRLHLISNLYWEHFNYSGFKPTASSYGLYEPLSTTTQFGGSIGVGYSF